MSNTNFTTVDDINQNGGGDDNTNMNLTTRQNRFESFDVSHLFSEQEQNEMIKVWNDTTTSSTLATENHPDTNDTESISTSERQLSSLLLLPPVADMGESTLPQQQQQQEEEEQKAQRRMQTRSRSTRTPSIPIAKPTSSQQHHSNTVPSASNSSGNSNSIMNSVLNNKKNNHQNHTSMLSHTPPYYNQNNNNSNSNEPPSSSYQQQQQVMKRPRGGSVSSTSSLLWGPMIPNPQSSSSTNNNNTITTRSRSNSVMSTGSWSLGGGGTSALSVSGRLRSASEYLDEQGLLDYHTKNILKDLIIIGDEELHDALDNYEEHNNTGLLEQMIRNGALQNRLPQDLDLLGDIDLDFLTMDDHYHQQQQQHNDNDQNDDFDPDEEDDDEDDEDDDDEDNDNSFDGRGCRQNRRRQEKRQIPPTIVEGAQQLRLLHQRRRSPNKISPNDEPSLHDATFAQYNNLRTDEDNDDGIGELEFGSGDFVNPDISDYDRRLRSNSLFSALLNAPASIHSSSNQNNNNQNQQPSRYATRRGTSGSSRSNSNGNNDKHNANRGTGRKGETTLNLHQQHYNQWMDLTLDDTAVPVKTTKSTTRRKSSGESDTKTGHGIKLKKKDAALLSKKQREQQQCGPSAVLSSQQKKVSGLTLLLQADDKKREKEELKEQKKKERLEKKEQKLLEKKKEEEEDRYQHVPGSGRPRSLSDPLLQYSIDEHGLQQCIRPDGWIGAYSPSSRTVRIQNYLNKRHHRVWTKSVKYDVRKNFADSRLRVKGRFVKKEEESLMRELMSLT